MKSTSNEVSTLFHQKKILTLNELTFLLDCSNTTGRRQLKTLGTYTSYNRNGRYYTLKQIPHFDKYGIWKYKNVCFSKLGTLQKTLQHLITHADAGLNIIEANKILGIPVQNILSQQFIKRHCFHREKDKGMYVYYSKDSSIAEEQKRIRYKLFSTISASELPTDAEAVIILVELIKHSNDSIEQLHSRAKYKGVNIPIGKIRNLLAYHNLLKKTMA